MAGGADPNGKSLGSTIARKVTLERRKRSVFIIPISMSPEICLGMDFRPEDGGIIISEATTFTGLVIQGCVKLIPPAIMLKIEVSSDVKLQADQDIPLAEKYVTMQASYSMEISLSPVTLTLNSFYAATLKSTSQEGRCRLTVSKPELKAPFGFSA
jgi:hypothetical protein